MRLFLIVLSLIVIASGVLFGVLNSARIELDFYFFQIGVPAGVALLCALLAGWLLGGLVAWFGQLSLRRQLRATKGRLREPKAPGPQGRGGDEA